VTERSNEIARRMLIDGQLVGAAQVFPSINPANGNIVGYAPNGIVAR
jgi:aldehyde dehydrogenase (NAD+)